jgi:type II secretory pathway component GspD/PulD (secretin)
LSSIPVLSFFFSRKGTYESYQKLIILLTANIILPEEHEPEKLPAGF